MSREFSPGLLVLNVYGCFASCFRSINNFIFFYSFHAVVGIAHIARYRCLDLRLKFDECMEDNMGLRRPEMGYFIKPKVHETKRPKPIFEHRDYDAEAAALVAELPEGSRHIKSTFKDYYSDEGGMDWGFY